MTYITTSNLYWDRFELDSLKEMPFTDSEIDKCTVTKGDLLVCEGGDIGRSAIWMFGENIRIQNHIHRLRPYISLSCRFYYYVSICGKRVGTYWWSRHRIARLFVKGITQFDSTASLNR